MKKSVYEATQSGYIDFLRKGDRNDIAGILDQETVQQKDNLLHIAANFKQLEFAKEIIRLDRSLLTRANSKGELPLHIASASGCRAMVDLLIGRSSSRGALCHDDIEGSTTGGREYTDMLRMVNEEGDTALHVAVKHDHFEVVNLLADTDIGLLCIDNKAGESPLYLAAERGFFDIAKHILDFLPECSHGGPKGMTALHAAVVRTHQGLEFGRGSLSILSLERQIWCYATREFSSRMIGCFLGNASRQHTDQRDSVPPESLSLERLRRFIYKQIFKLLNGPQETVSNGIDDIIKVLLEKKKGLITERDTLKRTPLHYAAQLGHLEAASKLLVECESLAYLLDEEDSSALHIAAEKGYINIIEEITKHCPFAHYLVDNKGWTILHIAAKFGKSKVVNYILKHPSWERLINMTDHQGNTALHLAAIYGHYKSVWILAGDHRADKKATNNEYLKAIDIVRSNIDIGEIRRYFIMRMMENGGAQPSLERLLFRENMYRKNNYNEEAQLQDINKSELREDRTRMSLHTSESLHDRNNEVAKKREMKSKYLKDVSNTHLLVSTLIATVTFAAGFSVPGGYNDDEPNKGKTVLSTETAFRTFVLTDAIAFYCSTAAVLLHFFASLEQGYYLLRRFIKIAALLTYISIIVMVVAFTTGIYVVLPNSSPIATCSLVLGSLSLCFYIFGFL